ncbi:DUF3293 domain-containing protein [Vibrio tritonius]|uniref:DUF3293 domain-containing protein n=1 Tax=Vibrio tritonius TaxID=1435069 RepID=UPI000838D026|nr:DUF3293 domain-containing protein [Vibrio tritonius]
MMKINAHLWQSYSEVKFDFEQDFLTKCYTVITAWNPRSQKLSHSENCLNNQRLQDELVDYDWVSVTVGDAKFEWFEESFAVAMELESALELARTFEQNAIYYVRNNILYLYSCVDSQYLSLGNIQEKIIKT